MNLYMQADHALLNRFCVPLQLMSRELRLIISTPQLFLLWQQCSLPLSKFPWPIQPFSSLQDINTYLPNTHCSMHMETICTIPILLECGSCQSYSSEGNITLKTAWFHPGLAYHINNGYGDKQLLWETTNKSMNSRNEQRSLVPNWISCIKLEVINI
jgi:hypothetical protein